MKSSLSITPIFNNRTQDILDLILPIQQIEFNVPVTAEAQPDLLDIDKYYHGTGGGFWGVVSNGELVGTIALISIGHAAGAIRKMFVKKEYRGKEQGIAQGLLTELIAYCRENGITHLYLGTVDMLKAAHRFYEKNGFLKIKSEDLPHYFPRMKADNVYYYLSLVSVIK